MELTFQLVKVVKMDIDGVMIKKYVKNVHQISTLYNNRNNFESFFYKI